LLADGAAAEFELALFEVPLDRLLNRVKVKAFVFPELVVLSDKHSLDKVGRYFRKRHPFLLDEELFP